MEKKERGRCHAVSSPLAHSCRSTLSDSSSSQVGAFVQIATSYAEKLIGFWLGEFLSRLVPKQSTRLSLTVFSSSFFLSLVDSWNHLHDHAPLPLLCQASTHLHSSSRIGRARWFERCVRSFSTLSSFKSSAPHFFFLR